MAADGPDQVAASATVSPAPAGATRWLRTPTGLMVGGFWLLLLVAALVLIRVTLPLMLIEVAAALFGFYASSVALRKDRTAGVVILIGLAFTFALLNWALYTATTLPFPLAR